MQCNYSSLVPVESLRPFEPNWELFSGRSTSIRFNQALVEAKNPDKYRHFELASSSLPMKAAALGETRNAVTNSSITLDNNDPRRWPVMHFIII